MQPCSDSNRTWRIDTIPAHIGVRLALRIPMQQWERSEVYRLAAASYANQCRTWREWPVCSTHWEHGLARYLAISDVTNDTYAYMFCDRCYPHQYLQGWALIRIDDLTTGGTV